MRPDSIDRREQFNQAPPVVPDFEAEAARLAQLPPHEYDRCRTKEAEDLKVRVPTLDAEVMKHRPKSTSADGADNGIMFPKLEPWPDPVDGGALLVKLFNAINRFVILPDGAAETIGLWVVQAHSHDAAEHSPLLAFTSPEKRSGKTTALRVLQPLVPRPLPTSNITTAALFRSIEMWRPTLLVDEADSFLGGNDELRGVLNSGHCRDQAFLIRSVGDDHTPTRFNTWGPKVVALIGRLPDTLEDRAIGIPMRRKMPLEEVERFQPSSKISLAPLARQCARWAEDNLPALKNADPKIPSGLHDRAADNWTLMFSIADAAGGRWPETARRIALSLSGEEDSSTRVRLLADIRDIFEREGRDRLPSGAICDALARMEDRPWPEWKKTGRPITTAALARQLAHFKIKPEGIRIGDKTPKGYKINQFGDTFTRYLGDSPFQSATPQQINDSAAYSPNQSATLRVDVAVSNARKPAEKLECCGVALPKGGIGQEDNSSPEIDDIEREAIMAEGSGRLG